MNIGDKLSEDKWFAYNTLKFVFLYLDLTELIDNASKVCPMWECILREEFLKNLFIPTCTKHVENAIEDHGENISRLQLVDTHQIVMEVSVFKAVSCSQNFNINNCHPQLVRHLVGEKYDFPLRNTFIRNIRNLTALRLYSDRIIFIDNADKKEFNSDTFYWRTLFRAKHLTHLEIGFHIPSSFGMKVLRHLTNLEVLKLHIYSGVDEKIFQSISKLINLKEVTILKVYVNEDLIQFLPTLNALEKVTIMIRAPCDTSYSYLLKSVLKLRSLKYFLWVINDVTVSDIFFGQNCQALLRITTKLFDKNYIESSLKNLFPKLNLKLLLADTEYFPKLRKDYKICLWCDEEKLVAARGLNFDFEDDSTTDHETFNSTYDMGEVNLSTEDAKSSQQAK